MPSQSFGAKVKHLSRHSSPNNATIHPETINEPSVHVRPRDRSFQSNGNSSLVSKFDSNKVHVHRIDPSATRSSLNQSLGSQTFNRSSVSIQRVQRSSDISDNSMGSTNRNSSDLISLNSPLNLSESNGSWANFDPSINSMPTNDPTVRISKVSRTHGPQPIGVPYPPMVRDSNQIPWQPLRPSSLGSQESAVMKESRLFDFFRRKYGRNRPYQFFNRPLHEKNDEAQRAARRQEQSGGFMITKCCCCCLTAILISIILIAAIIAAILLIALGSKGTGTNTPATTVTTTTATTSTTSTSATTSTTTTSITTTSSVTTTTSITTTSSATTTTSTTTSATTSTTATTTTTTTTSSTTTSTSTTSSTSATTTSTTTTTTTTSAYDSCRNLRWNQAGVTIIGDGSHSSAANKLDDPDGIYIDANDTIYIADHHNKRVQKYLNGSYTGIRIVDATVTGDHAEGITFDRNGHMYISGHDRHRVSKFSLNFANYTVVAGVSGTTSSSLNHLNEPLGMDIDDNFNLYVAERKNGRVTKWAPGASSGIAVVSQSGTEFYGVLLSRIYSNRLFVSSENRNAVYSWVFNAATPAVTLTQVNHTTSTLLNPRGLAYDPYNNLYVVDKGRGRIVMYCENSTMGRVVAGGSGSTPTYSAAHSVALDSALNLYVVDRDGQKVVKYNRI